jgi:glutamate synthase (NADPH/NADH) small chain
MAEYKMSQRVSVDEAKMVERLGVKFQLETEIVHGSLAPSAAGSSNQISFEDLQTRHDAIFLAIGLGATNRLNVPGENLEGVFDALDFIERVKTRDWKSVPLGRTVAVIGAGNTAIDAVTQAKRLGAERVLMIYRRTEKDISAYQYEYDLAKKDGIEFYWQTAPVEILPDGASGGGKRVSALRCEKTDGSNQAFEIPCDMVIKAIGQQKQISFLGEISGLALDEKGRIAVDTETMQTTNPRIFAGGDCVNGGREAVDAAQMGKLAAQGIHFTLTGEQIEFAGARLPQLEETRAIKQH